MAMAIPVGPFWEHPWEPQEAVTQALYECISVQVKPWPQSWGKLKAGMVRKVQLQPNLTSKIIHIQWWFCSIQTQFYIAAYESGHMTYGSFHLRAIGRATFSQNWKYKILKQLHRNINQFGERILIRTKVAACSKKMNPIGRRILCVQQVYLQYWVIYILPTSGYQNQTNSDLRLWRFSALFKRAFSGSSRDTIASDCTSWTFADVLLPFQMQIGVKSTNMQHIVGFTLTIRTVSFSLPANYIGRTIPATACSNMTLPWIRFAVWSACWRPRTRFVSPRSPPILEEWHCICSQRAVLKYIQKKTCCWYLSHPPLRNEFHRNETCTYILLSNAVRHQPLQYQIKTETLDCKCQPNQIWTAWPCKSNAMVAVRIFWNKDVVWHIFLFNELVSKKKCKNKTGMVFPLCLCQGHPTLEPTKTVTRQC